jgi:uncharacterized membrane protein YkvA (DUF1232 family)
MTAIQRWQQRAKRLKTETYALYLAYRDPRVPWYAKVLAAAVVAYAFSPVDLIPDFIPVLGYLDDLVLVPLGVALVLRMIPEDVLDQCRERALVDLGQDRPTNWLGAAVVVVLWLLAAAVLIAFAWQAIGR